VVSSLLATELHGSRIKPNLATKTGNKVKHPTPGEADLEGKFLKWRRQKRNYEFTRSAKRVVDQ